LKIHSKRLRKAKWNLIIPISQMRKNSELISLIDSNTLRWIDEINNLTDTDEKVKNIQTQIKKIKKQPFSVENKKQIKELYKQLDDIQFHPDYMCLIIDEMRDFDRANKKGFIINGTKYKRLLGTNGGVKNSTIVYTSESLNEKLRKRIDNGRNPNVPLVPAKMEAYRALTCSGSIPVSDPTGVLVVDDCETHFKEDIIRIDDKEDGEPKLTYELNQDIELVDSDGYGLISKELSIKWHEELGETGICSGFCIRNSWCKGMVFTYKFHEFAERIAKNHMVKDVWGNYVDIRNVQLILTASMLKLWNCYDSWEDYYNNCKENHYTFSVTKCCPNELENERYLNYQFLQSYNLNDAQLEELLKPTIDEIHAVLGGDYAKSILFLKGMFLDDECGDNLENDFVKALMIDPKMMNDPHVRNRIHFMIKKRINDAKIGKIKVNSNFSIISGDPYSLCQSMFGLEVTGLLKSGEAYNKYWVDKKADKVVCFRAPMTCHNNIRILKMVRNEDIDYWYEYMTTCTILNSWDTTTHALNGADKDSDQILITDNSILLNNTKQLPAIMCIQRKANKKIIDEESLIQANKDSFGDEIGKTTNRITTMIDLQSRFSPDSNEYKVLEYRIMCGQLFQQNAIDKTKGIIAKPMPKSWYNADICKIKDTDSEDIKSVKKFNLKIVANKKPYFMCYIYSDSMRRYKQYIENTNNKSVMEFRIGIDDLINKPNKTKREKTFLDYYYKNMPVAIDKCLLNRICWRIESEFDNYNKKHPIINDFDYSLLKSDINYNQSTFNKIKKQYEKYLIELNNYHTIAANQRIPQEEATTQRMEFKSRFKRECECICPNENKLGNIVLDLCYQNNKTKQFAWDICSEVFIGNLLSKNNYLINIPVRDDNGDIDFGGYKFKMIQQNVGDDIL